MPTIVSKRFNDGGIIHSPVGCERKYNQSPCSLFYEETTDKPEGFYICPSGYTVFHRIYGGEHVFYTGLLVKKHFKKVNTKKRNENNSEAITEKMFNDLVKEQEKYIDIQQNEAQSRELHRDLLHDVRKLDSLVKSKAEGIIREYESQGDRYHDLIQRVKNINAMEELIACKYSVYDLASNIEVLSMGNTSSVNIYKKFDKVRYILTDYKNKGIGIVFFGETTYEYRINISYSHILPFLLLENAVKYTIGDRPVEVFFEEHNSSLHVTIKSFGPLCEEDEVDRVYDKNFRGRNTKKHTSEGTGVGLYLAKQICNLCNVDIRISSDYVRDYNGIRCGYFIVGLIF